MLNNIKIQDYKSIQEYMDTLVSDLSSNAPSSSGELFDSIYWEVSEGNNVYDFGIYMADYGIYLDKGVSGTKRKFNTPFSYTTKMPPPKSLDKWIVRSGIAPRDSIKFMIAKSIQKKGIRPRNWIEPILDPKLDGLALTIAEATWGQLVKEQNKKN